jgi:hypothetical protein
MPPHKKQKLDAAAESPDGVDARKRKRQVIEAEDEGEPRGDERTEGRSIHGRLSGLALLIRDPRAAGLLISMAAVAAMCHHEGRRELLLPIIPPEFHTWNGMKDWHLLASTIDKLPALAKVPSACRLSEWLASIDGRLPCCFEWILGSFRGHLQEITLDPGFMEPGSNVILVKQGSSEAIRAFEDQKRSAGGSIFAFHASPLFNWHSILRLRIKIASGSMLQANGRSFGDGIYLGSEFRDVVCYSRMGDAWRNSSFGAGCIGLCEVVQDENLAYHGTKGNVLVVSKEANVMLRCLCVFSMPILNGSCKNMQASGLAALVTGTESYRTFFD